MLVNKNVSSDQRKIKKKKKKEKKKVLVYHSQLYSMLPLLSFFYNHLLANNLTNSLID